MRRVLVCLTSLALAGVRTVEARSQTILPEPVTVTESVPVEPSDLLATGGSFHDSSDAFWQVVIDRRLIRINGVASPTPPSMDIPAVRSKIDGRRETWITQAGVLSIRVQAIRERCVRDDGFVFRQKVILQVGARTFVTCGERGSDPSATKQ